MTTLPKIMICGNPKWAHEEVQELFDGVGHVIVDDAPNRVEFFARFRPGGPYEGTVGIYRGNNSAARIGIYDRELIAGLPHSVQWIALPGYDRIDVQACKEKGIRVSNTPGAVDEATATTALYLIVSTLRHFSKSERSLRSGTWKTTINSGDTYDLSTRTLGILGLGGVGLRLAHLAHVFPMRVLYYDLRRRMNGDVPPWCKYVETMEELCERSDVLSVHVPLTEDTFGLVGEREIRTMKRGSVVVNTARGKVLDEAAVIRALEDGHLASVGLDVYQDEPNVNPRLLEFPQNVLLPHVGTRTRDTERKMEVRAMTNLRDFLLTGSGKDLVPELR